MSPNLTINFGVRWEFEAPVTERLGRLVNLDVADDFSAAAPVIAADGIGPITGRHYPSSLIKSDPWGIQPRVGVAWRPIPTSSVVLRAGYGIYRNTSIYQSLAQQMAQQPPLSFAFNAVNTPATPLTLANGFIAPVSTTLNTVAFDPEFRVGTVHRWQASAQRDLPGALDGGRAPTWPAKGVNLPQSFIPNTYPAGRRRTRARSCPTGFVYTTSGGSSIQNAGQFELRRRLRVRPEWTTTYTLTKATDNASSFSGRRRRPIAQNWLDLDAERGPSSFEQRHLFRYNGQLQHRAGRRRRRAADRTEGAAPQRMDASNANLTAGSGTPRIADLSRDVGGRRHRHRPRQSDRRADRRRRRTAITRTRPRSRRRHPGRWGNAPRNSIRGPAQFSLERATSSRNFPVRESRSSLNWQIQPTNILNRVTYSSINTTVGSPQFGLPTATERDAPDLTTTHATAVLIPASGNAQARGPRTVQCIGLLTLLTIVCCARQVSRSSRPLAQPAPPPPARGAAASSRTSGAHPTGHPERLREGQAGKADPRADREGLRRLRGQPAAGDRLRRVSADRQRAWLGAPELLAADAGPPQPRRRRSVASVNVDIATPPPGSSQVSGPAAAGALLRSVVDAAGRSAPVVRERAEVPRHADGGRRHGGGHDVSERHPRVRQDFTATTAQRCARSSRRCRSATT